MIQKNEWMGLSVRLTRTSDVLQALQGKIVLITGGAGFIGRHLTKTMFAAGAAVRVLDDLSNSVSEGLAGGVDLRIGGIEDSAARASSLDGVDAVINLAAMASVPRCEAEPELNAAINHLAAVDLFRAAAELGLPIVHASTAALYGVPETPTISESHPIKPISAYGDAKQNAENDLIDLDHAVCALRLFNVYGPGQPKDSPYSGVLTIFTHRLSHGLPITIHGDGSQTRDFIHVSDIADAFALATASLLESGRDSPAAGRVFNVCTSEARTLNEITDILAAATEMACVIEHGPDREADIRHSVGESGAISAALGWNPSVDFTTGLQELMQLSR
jgi:UDP-glucose 4-epimerase